MDATQPVCPATAALLKGWLTARSIVRALPLPVPEHGGWSVDAGLPAEQKRYVFASPHPAIQALAATIKATHIFIKICGTGEQLQALLPAGWQLQSPNYLMTLATDKQALRPALPALPTLPAGYQFELEELQETSKADTTNALAGIMVRIKAADGSLAASGYAVEHEGYFIYDRIVTDAAHQRRGLGRALMAALGATRQSAQSQQVLVATEEGRALYTSLGWDVHTPYATAMIAADKE